MKIQLFSAAVLAFVSSAAYGQSQAVQWRVEDGGNGHWYQVTASITWNWQQAQDSAVARGGHLATLTSPAENAWVKELLGTGAPGQEQAFIGGFQDRSASDYSEPAGGWRWVTGEVMSWTAWTDGNPSNSPFGPCGCEDFMTMVNISISPISWNDVSDDFGTPLLYGSAPAIVEWSADCNQDGVVDYGQILAGQLADVDGNGVPDSCEQIAGHVLVADSEAGFTSTQGAGGWRYQFDRGAGTSVVPMQFFLGDRWCATPNYGGTTTSANWSHCTLTASWGHTNSGGDCNTPAQGTMRPIRTWTSPVPLPTKIRLEIAPEPASSGMRFDLIADGIVVWTRTWIYGDLPPADEVIDVPVSSVLSLVVDPLGSCGSDGAAQRIRIYSADCDGNGVADAVDLASGAVDVDANGVPDVCQCPADVIRDGQINGVDLAAVLGAWGTNGQGAFNADIDRDGVVNGLDLAYILSGWGPCP